MSDRSEWVPIRVYCRLGPTTKGTPEIPLTIERSHNNVGTKKANYEDDDGEDDGEDGEHHIHLESSTDDEERPHVAVTVSDPVQGSWVRVGFEDVFDAVSPQEHIFSIVARPLMRLVKEGFNAALLAYGQTSSGKTHTMFGPNGGDTKYLRHHEQRGIIPRVIEELLLEDEHIELSFLEIYNEVVTDLIAKVRGTGCVNYRGTERNRIERSTLRVRCKTLEHCMSILEEVSQARRVGSTDANFVSSRSHVIIQIRLCGCGGKLSLVDLAGSECVKKTNAKGIRMNETKNINTSLFALKKVIHSLYKQTDHIPYKDSILTAVLEDSLGGSAVTSLLVTCSSKPADITETIATVRFASEASCVKTRPLKKPPPPPLTVPNPSSHHQYYHYHHGGAVGVESGPSSHSSSIATIVAAEVDHIQHQNQQHHQNHYNPQTNQHHHHYNDPTSDAVIEMLRKQNAKLTDENERLTTMCRNATKEKETVEHRIQSLQVELDQVFDLIERIKNENEVLKRTKDEDEKLHRDMFDSLRGDLHLLQSQVADEKLRKDQILSLNKEVELLRTENEKVNVILRQKESELLSGTTEAQRLEVQCDRLTQEYNIMLGIVQDASQSVQFLQHQLQESRTLLEDEQKECSRYKEQSRQLARVNEQLCIDVRRSQQQQQHALRNSISANSNKENTTPTTTAPTNTSNVNGTNTLIGGNATVTKLKWNYLDSPLKEMF